MSVDRASAGPSRVPFHPPETAPSDWSDVWWRNAVVYCVDVESFRDSNGDGVGDFPGLTSRMDYLAGLGVTCLWLMPFYPTPNRDNGYDIVDFYGVDPRLGTLGDVVECLRAARERGIRVIADLVVNHTSDQHPWFQAARHSAESPYRDFYVWSEERPPDAGEGMIFPGEENSIYSFDPVAKLWYLHRFYRHQPDLNVANRAVREELKRIMGFWIELGLSGFRLDAVPFLIEHAGVDNPAVSDPHDYLRELRAFLSRRRGDAILLAEANEPADRLADFFGDQFGDQMHVLFGFIVNQALYLGLIEHDARVIERALRSLPPVPPFGQWANFVRNHDELSLDKLTDAQREKLFAILAPEPEMRLWGRGIRRRLPTMLGGDRRRMELLYSLAFSLPGIPVLFYGEEIGMGDDQSLPGRDAVRTAMQWTADPAAGFSSVPATAVIRPPVSGGPFGFERVNVEAQERDPGSFLNWMERLIRARKRWPELGLGEWSVVPTGRRSVLAVHARGLAGEVVALHNLSPRRSRVTLELRPASGAWRWILGSGDAPPLGDGPLGLTLDGYGYAWVGARRDR